MIETKNSDIRPIYQNLREIGDSLAGSVDTADLAQEILDFLAMAVGLKPTFLLGRGLDSPQWIVAATKLAKDRGFNVIHGPFWDATPFGTFPDWYKEHTITQLSLFQAVYVCSSSGTAREIGAINDTGGRLSMSDEARLLGYPECCVIAHYDRAIRYHRAIVSILRRLAVGDENQMRVLLQGGAALAPKTRGEIADMEAALELRPASFGSWNRCPYCVRNDGSPSAGLSPIFKSLAESTDMEWFRQLADTA